MCRYNSHGKFFKTSEYFRDFLRFLNQEVSIVWAICHISDGQIGNISLQEISAIDRTADFAILLGNKSHWGKGVARLAGRKLLEHDFLKLNPERINCGTAATNDGIKKLAAKLGMRLEARATLTFGSRV